MVKAAQAAESGRDEDRGAAAASPPRVQGTAREEVMQIEKHDFTDLVPTDRPRSQSLDGFDPEYTDIVDYIVRCTHRIWDEKNPGLIYSHYTDNAVVYGSLGISHTREEVVRATIQRIAEFPERRGMAQQVIWNGNDREGFYTSHLVTGVGRHIGPGPYGPPTGRSFAARTIADCLVFRNRIYREWLVRDNAAMLKCLGVSIDEVATQMAADQAAKGVTMHEVGEGDRLLGQYPVKTRADTGIAHSDEEAGFLQSLHEMWNMRMYGLVRDLYAPTVLAHWPSSRDTYGAQALLTNVLNLAALMPDATYTPHHIATIDSIEGGRKIAVRWSMDGHHMGWGLLGKPTQRRLFVQGMSHFHVRNGRIVEEWTLFDELALRVQLKLPVA
ncbi:MAG TPA: ester cyclase [Geminicoccaceae bacterium]|nr:ester cyclase [Geminicoccus sp.]HMU49033.1 ester cyclase [Geminicoccaceae bacterium]